MNTDSIRLGKLKKALIEAFSLEDVDRNVYLLSDSLDDLAKRFPDNYLRKLEGMSEIIAHPDYVSKGKNRLHLYRLYFENKKFYLTILTLERHQRWIYKSLQACSYPLFDEDKVVRMSS